MIFYSLLFWYCKYGHRIIWYTRRTCFSSAALHSSLRQSLGVERIHQDVLSEDLIPRYLQSFFTLATLSMFKHIRNTIFAMCDDIITIGLTLFFDTYIGSITLWYKLTVCQTLIRKEIIWSIPWRWLYARLNLCGTYLSKIYHRLCGWYVLTVLDSTSDNGGRLNP